MHYDSKISAAGSGAVPETTAESHIAEICRLFEELPLGPVITYTERPCNRMFTCFSKLPKELQIEIWKHTSCVPLIFRMWKVRRSQRRRHGEIMNIRAIPGTIKVNQESRAIMNQFYPAYPKSSFRSESFIAGLRACNFNPVHDIAYFDIGGFVDAMSGEYINPNNRALMRKIQCVAVDEHTLKDNAMEIYASLPLFFSTLKEFIVIVKDSHDYRQHKYKAQGIKLPFNLVDVDDAKVLSKFDGEDEYREYQPYIYHGFARVAMQHALDDTGKSVWSQLVFTAGEEVRQDMSGWKPAVHRFVEFECHDPAGSSRISEEI